MKNDRFVLGVDYGTDSVRTVLVNAATGNETSSSVFYYPRWKEGLYCNPSANQFRQHPLDYMEGLETTIKDCLQKAGKDVAQNVKAISVDTTGSTPIAVDKKGTPLALIPDFEDNPNAMFVLWKDHTAVQEAAAINSHAEKFEPNFKRKKYGNHTARSPSHFGTRAIERVATPREPRNPLSGRCRRKYARGV